jgi:hypothetical protein
MLSRLRLQPFHYAPGVGAPHRVNVRWHDLLA